MFLGCALIDKFSVELYIFETMSCFVPYHSYSKIGKHMDTQGKLAHVKRQTVFSIETVFNYTYDTVFNLS